MHRRFRAPSGLLARLLIMVLVVGLLPGTPAVAQEPPTPTSLAIPADADLAADAQLQPDDAPPALPETWDPVAEQTATVAAFDALQPADWDVADLATVLGPDAEAAFALVRDRIGFDAYAGSLRGAEGTLSGRGGNAVDRALLLQALLTAEGTPARLAFGTLDAATAQQVLDRSLLAPADPLPSVEGLGLPAATREDVATRARRDHARLRAALDAAGTGAPDTTADVTVALADVTAHAWVQAQIDGAWVDLDPTLPDAAPGTALTTATTTADTLPADLAHTVTIRLIAETATDGALARATVLERTMDAAAAADRQVLLFFGPTSGGGGGLLSVGGPDVVVPVLTVDGEPWLGTEMVVQADIGGGLLGGNSEVDLASLVLEVQTDAPGQEPQVARTTILDRVPADARAAGSFARGSLDPVAGPVTLPYALQGIRHVMVSTGGVSPRVAAWQRVLAGEAAIADATDPAAAARLAAATAYWPAGVMDQELVVASELDAIPAVDDDAVRAFAARPRVFLATVGVDPADPARITGITDLALDPLRILPRPGAAPDAAARHQVWYGALQTAIETELARRMAVTLDPTDRELVGVSLGDEAPLLLLTAADAATLPATTEPTLRDALAAGSTILLAGDPGTARTWWEIRTDGATRSVLAPSFGGVGRIGGGGGSGGIKPPRPVNPNPNNPNPKPPKPTQKPPTRAGSGRPAEASRCGGNENTVINQCVAFVTRITMEQIFIAALTSAALGLVAFLIALFTGSI